MNSNGLDPSNPILSNTINPLYNPIPLFDPLLQLTIFARAAGASAPEVGYGAPGEEEVVNPSIIEIP